MSVAKGNLLTSEEGVIGSLPLTPISADRPLAPEWVAQIVGVEQQEVAALEVNVQSFKLYESLITYSAQRAVDVGSSAPAEVERIHSDPLNEEREWPGRLSTIQCPPERGQEFWRYWDDSDDEESDEDDNDDDPESRTYAFGFGWAKLTTNDGEIVIIEHFIRGEPQAEDNQLSMFRVLVLYGAEGSILKKVCREAAEWSRKRDELMTQSRIGKYMLYTMKTDGCSAEWISHGHRRSRPLSSIVLVEGLAEEIVEDVTSFLKRDTKKWYLKHGLPYRRNFLFWGPPGCGKTSMIRSLAGSFELNACFMSLTHGDMSDQTLVEAMSKIPRRSILVFEDVDALFEDRKGMSKSNVTFSGLLNAVDGMMSPDGVMMVMTTNHRDKLDAALTRSGRVDRQFEFAPPGHAEVGRYFLSYYPDAKQSDADRFANAVMACEEEKDKTIATLQQHFIHCRTDSAEEAIQKYFPSFTLMENGKENQAESQD